MAVEKTLVRILDLPRDGKGWVWFADCNVLGLARWLDEEGRDRAISEAQDTWRSRWVRLAS